MKPKMPTVEKLLAPNVAEAGLTIAKVTAGAAIAGMGAPPGTDGVAVALIDSIFRPLMGRRYADFATSVMERLEQAEIKLEDVAAENEHFSTVYLQAAREAIVTHEQEKIDALRNMVCNTAKGIDIDAERQLLLFSIAVQLTGPHLKILKLLAELDDVQDVEDCAIMLYGKGSDDPDVNEEREMLLDGILSDLRGRALLQTGIEVPNKRTPTYEISWLGYQVLTYLS